jgi:hypothetical protein
MGCFSADAPDNRDYGEETRNTLQAQIDLYPDMLDAEEKFGPKNTELNLRNLQQYLGGSGDSRGLLDLYMNDISPALSKVEADVNTSTRTSDIQNVADLGPQALEAMRGSNPQQTALMDSLNERASEELALGGMMSPEQRGAIENSALAKRGAEGWGYNPGDMANAAMQATGYSDNLKSQRQQFGNTMVQQNQAIYGDPFQQILGRQGQSFGATPGVAGQAMGSQTGNLFNPESAYAGNMQAANKAYEAQFADPSLIDKIGMVQNSATMGLLGPGGSY